MVALRLQYGRQPGIEGIKCTNCSSPGVVGDDGELECRIRVMCDRIAEGVVRFQRDQRPFTGDEILNKSKDTGL
eukprot:SAG22_NODE_9156_length_607_cov_0.608268_1_plen_74_part_00